MHLGAIASGLAAICPLLAALPWALCAGLAATRVAVLAHWPTDVAAGFALGSAVEHSLRPFDSFRETLKAQRKYVARAQDKDGAR
jgi:membrane-associated phospholipid phosphatase